MSMLGHCNLHFCFASLFSQQEAWRGKYKATEKQQQTSLCFPLCSPWGSWGLANAFLNITPATCLLHPGSGSSAWLNLVCSFSDICRSSFIMPFPRYSHQPTAPRPQMSGSQEHKVPLLSLQTVAVQSCLSVLSGLLEATSCSFYLSGTVEQQCLANYSLWTESCLLPVFGPLIYERYIPAPHWVLETTDRTKRYGCQVFSL